nr:VTT domain-containing protein [Leptospira sp.]
SMSLGSILGGSLAYLIGLKLIPRFHLGRKMVLHYEDKLLPYLRKYGFWAVVLSALTPIPYSWMAYTVGTFKMPFHLFLLGSLFRIFRMSIYFFAMYLGWISGV